MKKRHYAIIAGLTVIVVALLGVCCWLAIEIIIKIIQMIPNL